MVLDHPELSDSVEQPVLEVIHIPDDVEQAHAPVQEEPNLALVVYQPPPIPQQQIFVGMINIMAGPPLPPEMIWSRALSLLLPQASGMQIPKPLSFVHVLPLVCSKRSWEMAFDEETMEFSISYIEEEDNLVEPSFAPALPLEEVP